jgi:hypothetical protein
MLLNNGRLTAKGKAQVASFAMRYGLNDQMLFDQINGMCYNNDGEVIEHCREFADITHILRETLSKEAV